MAVVLYAVYRVSLVSQTYQLQARLAASYKVQFGRCHMQAQRGWQMQSLTYSEA
jgi:hypothetical protein